MTIDETKRYLEKIYFIERNKAEISLLLSELKLSIAKPEVKGKQYVGSENLSGQLILTFFMLLWWAFVGGMAGTLLGYIFGGFNEDGVTGEIILTFALISTLIAFLCSLPNIKSEYKNLKNKRQAEEKNIQISIDNEKSAEIANRKNSIINRAIQEFKACETKTAQLLENLYQENIIHPKYRHYVAIATIYEYFDTGRCSELTGTDGAYNLFELESRLDKICSTNEQMLNVQRQILHKITEISGKLDDIKNNQYYLYTAMQESNKEISRTISAINKGVERLDEISVNTAATAYTTQIIEKNQYYERTWKNTY